MTRVRVLAGQGIDIGPGNEKVCDTQEPVP